MKQFDFTADEKIIIEAIINARQVQEFIWKSSSLSLSPFSLHEYVRTFQKRVQCIEEIDKNHPSWKIELRKRLLQQAALSIAAIKNLENTFENEFK